MKKYTFYTDLHLYSKYFHEPKPPMAAISIEQENAYLLGDILEGKNCEPQDLHQLKIDQQVMARAYKGRSVRGNHDGQFPGIDDIILPGGILLTHGDLVLWDDAKARKFRAERMGQGSGWKQKIFSMWHGSVSNSEAKLAATYAKARGCSTVVFGHVHPKVKFEKFVDGVNVICLPRGKSELYL